MRNSILFTILYALVQCPCSVLYAEGKDSSQGESRTFRPLALEIVRRIETPRLGKVLVKSVEGLQMIKNFIERQNEPAHQVVMTRKDWVDLYRYADSLMKRAEDCIKNWREGEGEEEVAARKTLESEYYEFFKNVGLPTIFEKIDPSPIAPNNIWEFMGVPKPVLGQLTSSFVRSVTAGLILKALRDSPLTLAISGNRWNDDVEERLKSLGRVTWGVPFNLSELRQLQRLIIERTWAGEGDALIRASLLEYESQRVFEGNEKEIFLWDFRDDEVMKPYPRDLEETILSHLFFRPITVDSLIAFYGDHRRVNRKGLRPFFRAHMRAHLNWFEIHASATEAGQLYRIAQIFDNDSTSDVARETFEGAPPAKNECISRIRALVGKP